MLNSGATTSNFGFFQDLESAYLPEDNRFADEDKEKRKPVKNRMGHRNPF